MGEVLADAFPYENKLLTFIYLNFTRAQVWAAEVEQAHPSSWR